MSYLVLARKWRPQQFNELLGQQHVCQTLQNAIKNDRIAHAFLFCGPRGVGKTSAARILAKTLICRKSTAGKPCNECENCGTVAKGMSVDVIEIDGASNNGIDSIRDLREKAHYLPTQGETKVYIIDEVHMLSSSAFNALLKILEEPPAHLKFIFATTEVHKIPSTILSRCQRFDFKKIPLKQLQEHLGEIAKREKIQIENDALLKISKESQGSFRDGISLLDQANAYADGKITLKDLNDVLGTTDDGVLFDLLEKILKRESKEALKLLSKLYERGQDVKQLAAELLECLRTVLLIKFSNDEDIQSLFDLTDHEVTQFKKCADLSSLEEIEQAFHIMLTGSQNMAYTLYPQFVFEATLVKLFQLKNLTSIQTLIDRLDGAAPSVSQSTPKLSGTPQKKDWGKVVAFVRLKKPSLAAVLEHGLITDFSKTKIVLGFPKDSVFIKLISETDNKKAFQTLASEYLGSRVAITINEIGAGADTKLTSLANDNENEISRIKKEALKHEMIQKAQKLFDGKILDVKVDKHNKELSNE